MKKKESFAVLGLSRFGRQTAVGLAEAGLSVIAVDMDEQATQKISHVVAQAVCADVMDWDVMEQIGVFDVGVVIIGLRSSFEAAVLLTNHIHKETDVQRVIAQVDSDEKAEVLRLVGADTVVFPARDTANYLVKKLTMPGLVEYVALSPDSAIVEIAVPDDFIGKTLVELSVRSRYKVQVIGILRGGAAAGPGRMITAPSADTRFEEGDTVVLLGNVENLNKMTG